MPAPTTLTGLLHRVAGIYPSHRAVSVSGKFHLTHSRLHHLVERAAARLLSAGIKPGDVVALTFPNTVEVLSALTVSLPTHRKHQLSDLSLTFIYNYCF